MPIKKIRDLQEMEDSLWYEPGDPALWRAIEAAWKFAEQTCPQRFPPGVYKHRTLEDAQRQRDLWEEQNFKAFWERRGIDPKSLR
ncbi:MAG TPA: hypothetical protein VGS07_34350 [Thermoanaerobaculia bacterium]|jgi:hypothetical protein|nr:hypothetical protein [Thermoanaerobaculia bacterium]